MRPKSFSEILDNVPHNMTIMDAVGKCYQQVKHHEKIKVSISGGADSDILMDMVIMCGGREKSTFVFYNTGLEYKATKKHLQELEKRYGVNIEIVPPVIPIPKCVKDYGVPFWSKRASEMIMRLQKHGFQWEDEPLEVLVQKYPDCKAALRWWCNDYTKDNGTRSALNIEWAPWLKEFMIENPPDFKISAKCCHYAKKAPAKKYAKRGGYDLDVIGVRKAEGGTRATGINTCFSPSASGPDMYRPLLWFTDADKSEYDDYYGLDHSDCYKVWGMTRTGCAGCPFGKEFEDELALAAKFEPNFHKAMLKVFGKSYEYTRKYLAYREKMKRTTLPFGWEQLEIDLG